MMRDAVVFLPYPGTASHEVDTSRPSPEPSPAPSPGCRIKMAGGQVVVAFAFRILEHLPEGDIWHIIAGAKELYIRRIEGDFWQEVEVVRY